MSKVIQISVDKGVLWMLYDDGKVFRGNHHGSWQEIAMPEQPEVPDIDLPPVAGDD